MAPLGDPRALAEHPLLLQVWEAMGGSEAWLTGGFLRDHLIGRPSVDIDLTLPGDADSAAAAAHRLASSLATRAHLLGQPPHRVWRVSSPSMKVEIWPLGRLSLEADIRRRDFACNALVWRLPAGPLDDRVGGVDDLRRRRLRALSADNLAQDPVRLLRAPRLLAVLDGFHIERRTRSWIRDLAPRLAVAPRERVGTELLALLGGRRAGAGLAALASLGLAEPAAPAGCHLDERWLRGHQRVADRLSGGARHPLPAALGEAGDAARLAPLLRTWSSPEPRAIREYAWPRPLRCGAAGAAALLDRARTDLRGTAAVRRELMRDAGAAYPVLIAVAAALWPRPEAEWRRAWLQWRRSGATVLAMRPVLSASEVAELGRVGPGPRLGRLLDELTRAQVRGEVRSRAGARRWLVTRRSARSRS